jgi:hypothetical protein
VVGTEPEAVVNVPEDVEEAAGGKLKVRIFNVTVHFCFW